MFKKLFDSSVAASGITSSASSASSVTNTTVTNTTAGGNELPVDQTAATLASGATNLLRGGKRRSRSNRTNNHVVSEEKQYNIRLV
jgi:hypothetical protein